MFSLEVLDRKYDLNSPEVKTDFMREAARRLTEFDEEVERTNYIEAVAATYRVRYEDLRKLVSRVAVQTGQGRPAERPKTTSARKKEKEDGIQKSQKVLLTWMIEDEAVFRQIEQYIAPADFSEGLYRTVAELLYEQYASEDVNPAKIMNHFTDEEEHREVASLFHTKIRELSTEREQEKALKETVIRVKNHSIDEAARRLEPTDMKGFQQLMDAKRELKDLQKLHISVN